MGAGGMRGRARILAAGLQRHHRPVRLGEAALRARITLLTLRGLPCPTFRLRIGCCW